MKITVLQENLQKAVANAARAASNRTQLPILGSVLLAAEAGKLLVVGSDMTTSVGQIIGGQVQEEGKITVPAKDFAALVGGLAAGRVVLEAKKGVLSVVGGNIRSKLVGAAADEYPDISLGDGASLIIPAPAAAGGINRVLFAASGDGARPMLTGVKLESLGKTDGLRLTATDGYRLSMVTVGGVKGELKEDVIVPSRTLGELVRLAGGEKISLRLTGDGGAVFSFEGGWVTGRLLAGEFPDAGKVVPDEFDLEIILDRESLERAVRTAAIFARDTANIIKFKIVNDKLQITANSPQIGENESVLDVIRQGLSTADSNEASEIAFNSRYLLDYLGSVGDVERIKFRMIGPLKPGMFVLAEDASYLHVVMPVRVQGET